MVFIYPGEPMYQKRCDIDGVRSHVWFKGYHVLSILDDIFLAAFTIIAWEYRELSLTFLLTLLGTFCLAWECFELAYSYARYKVFIPLTENVFGYHAVMDGVWLLHIARLLVGIALIAVFR
ncbi:MAG: hypothetical protein PHS93_07760 [Candidatus Omnitrophica bacterium]|nr:hypothetical protein [Candidatus Omnitrophota bacterium]